jgi:hypothetical protein
MHKLTKASDIAIIFAPAVGGLLAEPAKQYPDSFIGHIRLFAKLPYLLPCLAVSAVALLALLTTLFLFKETLGSKVDGKGGEATEEEPLLGSAISAVPLSAPDAPSLWQLLRTPEIRQPLLAGFCNVFASLSFDSVFVLFAYSSVSLGGLGLNARAIAFCLTFRGIVSILAALFLFAPAQRKFGGRVLYRLFVCMWPITFALLPAMHYLVAQNEEGLYVRDGMVTPKLWPLSVAFPSRTLK